MVMEFVNPNLLWGALAVAVPILIHVWHRKKGSPIAWAATRWLHEKDRQQHRGLRLDNLLLLLLRCLLLLLLALLLSEPLFRPRNQTGETRKIHLVQPQALVVGNFRFELEEAARKGEELRWLNPGAEPVEKGLRLPDQAAFHPLLIQPAVHRFTEAGDSKATELHLYLLNDRSLGGVPSVYVPVRFLLHTVVDSASRPVRPYLQTKGSNILFVNDLNRLSIGKAGDPGLRLAPVPAHTGPFRVLLSYSDPTERRTVEAALAALAEVYGIAFQIDRQAAPAATYDWVMSDREIRHPAPRTFYVVSGPSTAGDQRRTDANVIRTGERSLTPQTSELVAGGQLPERLGEWIVRQYNLHPITAPLSRQQLQALFIRDDRPGSARGQSETVQTLLTLLFVLLVGTERWIALRKNT